jgi:hypothetical protein
MRTKREEDGDKNEKYLYVVEESKDEIMNVEETMTESKKKDVVVQ